MENKPILGELLKGGEERDAIHIAILPVTAGDYIAPGQRVHVKPDGWANTTGDPNAVADPFLRGQIYPGQKFYALLFPYTIESLRHEWVHRDFPKEEPPPRVIGATPDVQASIDWMNDFLCEINTTDYYGELSLEGLLKGADDWISHGEYLSQGGLLEGHYVPSEFWSHYERIRGVIVPEGSREDFFSCSC